MNNNSTWNQQKEREINSLIDQVKNLTLLAKKQEAKTSPLNAFTVRYLAREQKEYALLQERTELLGVGKLDSLDDLDALNKINNKFSGNYNLMNIIKELLMMEISQKLFKHCQKSLVLLERLNKLKKFNTIMEIQKQYEFEDIAVEIHPVQRMNILHITAKARETLLTNRYQTIQMENEFSKNKTDYKKNNSSKKIKKKEFKKFKTMDAYKNWAKKKFGNNYSLDKLKSSKLYQSLKN
jgi:hypothetical protein